MELSERIISALNLAGIFGEPYSTFEEPIRYEVFAAQRLELHAAQLASRHTIDISPGKARHGLASRIHQNRRILWSICQELASAGQAPPETTLAARLLIAHFPLVSREAGELSQIPSRYYRRLPLLSSGAHKHYPRMYGLLWSFVAHTDSRFEAEQLGGFLAAYQRLQPLEPEELQAAPIMLRVLLIENLRRSAVRIAAAHQARCRAVRLAVDLRGPAAQKARDRIESMTADPPPLPFIAQLVHCLEAPGLHHSDPARTSLRKSLLTLQTTADEVVLRETAQQTLAAATVRNIISSLRDLSGLSWDTLLQQPDFSASGIRPDSCPLSDPRNRPGLLQLVRNALLGRSSSADPWHHV